MKRKWLIIGKFSFPLVYHLQNLPANEKQGPMPEGISQSLLTIKSKIKVHKFPIYQKKYV
jgi:hypothetical protein